MIGLNVGCGPLPGPAGWLKLDLAPEHAPAVVATADALPFPARAFSRVYLGHVLEHVPWHLVGSVLEDVNRVLTAGGELLVVGPDVRRAVEGGMAWDQLTILAEDRHPYGLNQRVNHDGGRHHWNCTAERVTLALRAAGFSAVEVDIAHVPDEWPVVSSVWWQCAVLAAKR